MKKRVNLSFTKEIYETFKKYCDENGYKASSLLEKMMKDFLKKKGVKYESKN